MKVGLSASFLEKSLNNGIVDGIGHYSKQVYEGLNSRGYKAVPFAFPSASRNAKITYSTPFPRSYVRQMVGAKLGVLKPLSPPVDVFHVTDFRSVPMDVPVISTLWDAIPFVHPEWMRAGIGRNLTPRLFKESARHADFVVCTSEHAAKDIVKYYMVPDHKINIIPWCISEHWKNPISSDLILKVQKKFEIKRQYILCVGTLQPRKNIDRLVDAVAEIQRNPQTNDLALVIVGKVGWGCEELLKKISKHRDYILHLDRVDDDEELRAIYQGAKVIVFPSLYEGFGMPVLEAFASGVPLIASNLTSIPEVAGDAAMLVDPLSVKAIASALTEVLVNEDVAQDLVSRGEQRLSLFREDLMVDKLLNLYSRTLGG